MTSEENLLARITVDPNIMVGKPVIRGMRITVDQILKSLASEISIEEILEDYPELQREDINAVLLYASQLVSHERVFTIGAST